MTNALAQEWYYPRRGEASRMLFTLRHAGASPVWFVGPKSTGKTTFLQNDLMKMAEGSSLPYLPVYIPLGADRDDPLQVMQASLDKVLAERKSSPWGRFIGGLTTEIEEVGVDELKVKFRPGEAPQHGPSAFLKLDRTLDQLSKLSKKPLLLVIDDAQFLLGSSQSNALCTCLRAMISARSGRLNAVFALDSRRAAEHLFARPGTPFHAWGREAKYAPADHAFVEHMVNLFEGEARLKLDRHEMRAAFDRLHGQPRAFMSVLSDMMADGLHTPEPYIEGALAAMHTEGDWSGVYDNMTRLEKLILNRLAAGLEAKSDSALSQYAGELQRSFIQRKTVERILDQLVKKEILAESNQSYSFRSDELHSWIQRRTLPGHYHEHDLEFDGEDPILRIPPAQQKLDMGFP